MDFRGYERVESPLYKVWYNLIAELMAISDLTAPSEV